MNCPGCGAADGLCRSRFEEYLALEFPNAGYGAVHHLTVATYMVQHSSKLTPDGWRYERALLREFLIENKPPAQVRKEAKNRLDSGKRAFRIKSRDRLPVMAKSTWSKTILDVRAETAEQYREDVSAWARSVLAEAEAIAV